MLFRRFTGLFGNLTLLQMLVIDVYFGGFLLYVVAIVPLQLFSVTLLYAITLVFAVIVLWFHRGKFETTARRLHLRLEKLSFRNSLRSESVLIALLFLFSLVVQTLAISGLIFGSVRDTSIHSLFAEVLIENKQVPVTLQPYLSEGIIYPQGFTPMVAYAALILNYSPPQAVFYLTSLFSSLTVLGVYFLGKELSLSRKGCLSLSLACVFAFVASWPKYITWGSNAFVASLPLYFVSLSLFPLVMKEKLNGKRIFLVGLLFGFLAVLHLATYEALIASFFMLWVYAVLKKQRDVWDQLLNLVVISGLGLLVLSPFLYRQLIFYQFPYHNTGVPADVQAPVPQPSLLLMLNGAEWFLENLAGNTFLIIASIVLFFVSILIIARFRKNAVFNEYGGLVKLGIVTLLGELLVLLLAAINPSDLPFYPNQLLLYFPLYFFIAAANLPLYSFLSTRLSRKILPKTNNTELKTKKVMVSAISFMLLVGIYSPFLYQSTVLDVWGLHGSYAVFGVTTEQDLKLMLWIRENLTGNATILVNNFQSGTFIPSIADRKALYPAFGSSYSVSYQKLVAMLENNNLNGTAMNFMTHFNVTDVYVGSGVSPWDGGKHKWNPDLFLGNPNFNLMKNFSDAYLFQFNYFDPNTVFLDDFEHEYWNEYAWQTYFYGHGLSNVTIATNSGSDLGRGLRVEARVVPTAWEWMYAQCVYRNIYVQNNSDVAFSFYLNATEGFHGQDTFAVLISNIYRNQSIVIASPNSVYSSYAHTISLNGSEGFFEFNGSRSLSTLWHQMYSSSLPSTFLLEFVNLDFDGIENVAYIDNVKVTSTPSVIN
jgi:hypothetical protein